MQRRHLRWSAEWEQIGATLRNCRGPSGDMATATVITGAADCLIMRDGIPPCPAVAGGHAEVDDAEAALFRGVAILRPEAFLGLREP